MGDPLIVKTLILALLSGPVWHSMGDSEVEWLRGRELDRALLLPRSVDWDNARLGPRLHELSRRQKIAVFIDRRVDPTRRATFTIRDATWEQLVWQLAAEYEVGVCRLDNVYYFGPVDVCRSLPVLFERLKVQMSRDRKEFESDWRRKSDVHWRRLGQPLKLLEQAARRRYISIENPGKLHFDLWDEQHLPKMSFIQQAVLLVVGFDCWLEAREKGRVLYLTDYPQPESGTLTVGNVQDARAVTRKLAEEFPDSRVRHLGRSVTLQGSLNDIARMRRKIIDDQRPFAGENSYSTFALQATNSRGVILQSLCRQLGVELQYEPELKRLLDERIELKIDATAPEIIEKVLHGTGLSFRLTRGQLRIVRE